MLTRMLRKSSGVALRMRVLSLPPTIAIMPIRRAFLYPCLASATGWIRCSPAGPCAFSISAALPAVRALERQGAHVVRRITRCSLCLHPSYSFRGKFVSIGTRYYLGIRVQGHLRTQHLGGPARPHRPRSTLVVAGDNHGEDMIGLGHIRFPCVTGGLGGAPAAQNGS